MPPEATQLEADPRSALQEAERNLAAMSGRDRPNVPDLHDSIETLMNAARAARRARSAERSEQDRLASHLEKLESGISSLREALAD